MNVRYQLGGLALGVGLLGLSYRKIRGGKVKVGDGIRPGKEGNLDLGDPATWPGRWSAGLSEVSGDIRRAVSGTISDLADYGYVLDRDYTIGSTWRSKERQEFLVKQGWSRTMRSKHAVDDSDGKPAARAVDFYPAGMNDEEAARFYAALASCAVANGLTSGANWSRTSERWAKYGLGWDPGHIEGAWA